VSLFESLFDHIDDPLTFRKALERPLPTVVWANPVRGTPDRLEDLLGGMGIVWSRSAWSREVFRLPPGLSLGRTLPYLAGLMHVQEEASILAARILDPAPGETVLDLCAAPGGKTAWMATHMANAGMIIANDISTGRAVALRANLDRLGVVNTAITNYDAATIPLVPGSFDAVLADVPCSCSGTVRQNPAAGIAPSRERLGELVRAQTEILASGIRACKAGGRVLYSTCSLLPEENEGVLSRIFDLFGDSIRLRPIRQPGVTLSPPIPVVDSGPSDGRIVRARRLYPHTNDTGGFFFALIEVKSGGDARGFCGPDRHAESRNTDEALAAIADLELRFGIPEKTLASYVYHQRGRKYLYAASPSVHIPDGIDAAAIGLPVLRMQHHPAKLSTHGACLWGHLATRNVVELSRQQANAYLKRAIVAPDAAQIADCRTDGSIIVRWNGYSLGTAWLGRTPNGSPRLASLYPKSERVPSDGDAFSARLLTRAGSGT
jgi:16S rRNA C967 or C1407 C5-methylase (RsmB/RsmF family)/NOL1/NOP2/fmu family ribosome biogenesis protein